MGLKEARQYISDLRKKQGDPYLWPDFLTGLPDKKAVIRKKNEAYPMLGKYAVSYVRIANIHPYLIKYGAGSHAEIIHWAAAILKTTADKYKGFVGAFGTHDFVVISEAKNLKEILREASELFGKKAKTFYSPEDLKRKTVLSFNREGERVEIGFMRLINSTVDRKTDISRDSLLPHLERLCSEQE
jgi:GGDEF domain-containing protein